VTSTNALSNSTGESVTSTSRLSNSTGGPVTSTSGLSNSTGGSVTSTSGLSNSTGESVTSTNGLSNSTDESAGVDFCLQGMVGCTYLRFINNVLSCAHGARRNRRRRLSCDERPATITVFKK
jgi:hypothetical protein